MAAINTQTVLYNESFYDSTFEHPCESETTLPEYLPDVNMIEIISDHIRNEKSSYVRAREAAEDLLHASGRAVKGQLETAEYLGLASRMLTRGQLKVNSMYQTAQPHVYAVGDVIGYPSLASAAYDQGRIAAQALVKGEATAHLIEDIPTGIYTIPEISSVGKTEQQLTAMKVPYEVGRAQFKHLARAQIVGMNVGTLKILFHRETKEILGIHCFGERAAEIIHIGQAIMEQKGGGNTIEYFVNTTFNYPTMAEAYRVAALNGLNRLF